MHWFKSIIFSIFFFCSWQAGAQVAYLENRFLNDFTRWEFFDYNENKVGTLETRFMGEGEIREWNVSLPKTSYTIESIWPDRMDEWVLKSDNQQVSATVQWTDDYTQWVIEDDFQTLYLRGDMNFNLNVWYVDDSKQFWEMFTTQPNAFGSWTIDDRLEETSPEMKVMLLFIASFYAVRL